MTDRRYNWVQGRLFRADSSGPCERCGVPGVVIKTVPAGDVDPDVAREGRGAWPTNAGRTRFRYRLCEECADLWPPLREGEETEPLTFEDR